MSRTWILTGSPENHAATAAHGCAMIGLTERNRRSYPWSSPAARELAAFQGQIRPVSEHDATVLMQRLSARAGGAA